MRSVLSIAACLSLLWLSVSQAATVGQGDEVDWGDDEWSGDSWGEADQTSRWHGFFEAGLGQRIHADPALERLETLEEVRVRLETSGFHGDNRYLLKGDLYLDGVEEQFAVDLREASYSLTLSRRWDLKLGQQVLTWGTGDLLFVNDLFAKDWQSFFSGRETEYLKAPSAAARASYFGEQANLDLIWIPDFIPDRYISGERFSYFSPGRGSNVAAPAARIDAREPDNNLPNGELAGRVYGTLSATEWALYGYRGFQPQPNAVNSRGEPVFTRLDAVGASIRAPLGQGLANAEVAWYLAEDSRGDNPRQPNDQFRLLLGYEREVLPKLTLGLQYYLEQTLDYDRYRAATVSPFLAHEYRYLYTARLNYRMWQDNLTWSLFVYHSPSDDDQFIRPSVSYRFDDRLSATIGANLFSGRRPHTFFGQFEEGSNLYGRLRYAF